MVTFWWKSSASCHFPGLPFFNFWCIMVGSICSSSPKKILATRLLSCPGLSKHRMLFFCNMRVDLKLYCWISIRTFDNDGKSYISLKGSKIKLSIIYKSIFLTSTFFYKINMLHKDVQDYMIFIIRNYWKLMIRINLFEQRLKVFLNFLIIYEILYLTAHLCSDLKISENIKCFNKIYCNQRN